MDAGGTVRVLWSCAFLNAAKVTLDTQHDDDLLYEESRVCRTRQNQSSMCRRKISRVTLLMGLDASSQCFEFNGSQLFIALLQLLHTSLSCEYSKPHHALNLRWDLKCAYCFSRGVDIIFGMSESPESLDGFHQRTRRRNLQLSWCYWTTPKVNVTSKLTNLPVHVILNGKKKMFHWMNEQLIYMQR